MKFGRIALAPMTHGDTYRPWYFDAIDDSDLPYNGFVEGTVVAAEIRTSLGALVFAYTSAAGNVTTSGQRVSFGEIPAAVVSTLIPGSHRVSARATWPDGRAQTFLQPQQFGIVVNGARNG